MRFKPQLACVRSGAKSVKIQSLTHFLRFSQGEFSSAFACSAVYRAQFKPVMY